MAADLKHTEIFQRYFQTQFWGNRTGSSGPNSDPALTPVLRQNLENLLREYGIRSLLDAGCGDANLFKNMKVENLNYLGFDCVPELTALNQSFFKHHPQMKFETRDIVKAALPKVDLILCRDVVHYLPNKFIEEFLENCRRSGSKYLLITHNIHAPLSANTETELGIFRPVNLTQNPFHWPSPLGTIAEDVFGKELGLFGLEIQPGQFIPDNERWLYTKDNLRGLDEAIAWSESHPRRNNFDEIAECIEKNAKSTSQ